MNDFMLVTILNHYLSITLKYYIYVNLIAAQWSDFNNCFHLKKKYRRKLKHKDTVPLRVITMNCSIKLSLSSIPLIRRFEWYMRCRMVYHRECTHLQIHVKLKNRIDSKLYNYRIPKGKSAMFTNTC